MYYIISIGYIKYTFSFESEFESYKNFEPKSYLSKSKENLDELPEGILK